MIIKIFLMVFLSVSTFLKADDFEKKAAKVISLGGTCHTAIALRDLGFRKESLPFDWVITTEHQNFIKILDEDFNHFLEDAYFTRVDGIPAQRNIYYSLDFPHDFNYSNNRQIEWATFQGKYERRIERFRALNSYEGKVFFVRVLWSQRIENGEGQFNENTKRTEELRDALDRFFPELDYTLIIWSHTDLEIPPLEPLDRVIEFRLPKAHQPFYDEMTKLLVDHTI